MELLRRSTKNKADVASGQSAELSSIEWSSRARFVSAGNDVGIDRHDPATISGVQGRYIDVRRNGYTTLVLAIAIEASVAFGSREFYATGGRDPACVPVVHAAPAGPG